MTIAAHAITVAIALDVWAFGIDGDRPRGAALFALHEWERACIRALASNRRTVLPPWPQWRGVRSDPGRLAVTLAAGGASSGEVEHLADECRRWAGDVERRMAS